MQKLTGEHDGCAAYLLFSLGGYSKQAGDERDLPGEVSFVHSLHLSFPKHVLCWLHEISAEEIESFPLHLPDVLTAEMNME